MANVPNVPYKEEEFEAFLKSITLSQQSYWYEIAQSLGIDRKTIYRWKQHPKAKELINKELEEALAKMKETGNKDWRMWRERTKILGLPEKTELDITSLGEPITKTDEQLDALIADKLKKLIPQGETGTSETFGRKRAIKKE